MMPATIRVVATRRITMRFLGIGYANFERVYAEAVIPRIMKEEKLPDLDSMDVDASISVRCDRSRKMDTTHPIFLILPIL